MSLKVMPGYWLLIFVIFTLFFLVATFMEPGNITTNFASFCATMMGVGAGGLATFYLVDRESKRRQDRNVLWYYKSVLGMALQIAALILFYNDGGFRLLKNEEKYPFEQQKKALEVTKAMETIFCHPVEISKLLNEMCNYLKYMNYRMKNRKTLQRWGLSPGGSDEISELSRSMLNDLYPMITEFFTDVLNPMLKDVEDIEIRDAMFELKQNYNAFNVMYHYTRPKLGLDFNQTILKFLVDFIRFYELLNEKYPVGLKLGEIKSTPKRIPRQV